MAVSVSMRSCCFVFLCSLGNAVPTFFLLVIVGRNLSFFYLFLSAAIAASGRCHCVATRQKKQKEPDEMKPAPTNKQTKTPSDRTYDAIKTRSTRCHDHHLTQAHTQGTQKLANRLSLCVWVSVCVCVCVCVCECVRVDSLAV